MPAGALNVKNYGAKGDGVTDDTNAINAAVTAAYNGGGGTVWVPNGTYMIRTSAWGGGINMKSNTSLYLASGAVLKQIANSYDGSYIVAVKDISNVTITGGTIIGDRHTHTGTSGEWGMGIDIEGSTNITISNITVQDCWGDGIYIGSSYSKTYSQNVTVQNAIIDGNRRNAIAVISAKQLTIKDSTVSNTDGTMPGSGIDMEPNYSNEFMQDVTIQNIKSYNNGVDGSPFGGWAMDIWFGCGTENPDVTPKTNVSIKISNVTDSGSYRGLFTTNFSHYISYGYNIVK